MQIAKGDMRTAFYLSIVMNLFLYYLVLGEIFSPPQVIQEIKDAWKVEEREICVDVPVYQDPIIFPTTTSPVPRKIIRDTVYVDSFFVDRPIYVYKDTFSFKQYEIEYEALTEGLVLDQRLSLISYPKIPPPRKNILSIGGALSINKGIQDVGPWVGLRVRGLHFSYSYQIFTNTHTVGVGKFIR
ncbi:MAG: hypothetical protein AAFW00_19750 [Bacteroidota bacterium]